MRKRPRRRRVPRRGKGQAKAQAEKRCDFEPGEDSCAIQPLYWLVDH